MKTKITLVPVVLPLLAVALIVVVSGCGTSRRQYAINEALLIDQTRLLENEVYKTRYQLRRALDENARLRDELGGGGKTDDAEKKSDDDRSRGAVPFEPPTVDPAAGANVAPRKVLVIPQTAAQLSSRANAPRTLDAASGSANPMTNQGRGATKQPASVRSSATPGAQNGTSSPVNRLPAIQAPAIQAPASGAPAGRSSGALLQNPAVPGTETLPSDIVSAGRAPTPKMIPVSRSQNVGTSALPMPSQAAPQRVLVVPSTNNTGDANTETLPKSIVVPQSKQGAGLNAPILPRSYETSANGSGSVSPARYDRRIDDDLTWKPVE